MLPLLRSSSVLCPRASPTKRAWSSFSLLALHSNAVPLFATSYCCPIFPMKYRPSCFPHRILDSSRSLVVSDLLARSLARCRYRQAGPFPLSLSLSLSFHFSVLVPCPPTLSHLIPGRCSSKYYLRCHGPCRRSTTVSLFLLPCPPPQKKGGR